MKTIVFANLLVAPIPRATVAILWTANAFIKGILNNNNIAGNWITPAPPPENAEIFGDVDWPSKDEIQLNLEKSFTDRIIDTADHDVVRRTRGLVI